MGQTNPTDQTKPSQLNPQPTSLTPMIFAQLPATPTALEIAAWIGCLFFLVAGWNQVERFFDRRASRGQPREIQPQPLAVSKFDAPVGERLCHSRAQEVSGEMLRLEQEVGSLGGGRGGGGG